MNDDTIAAFSFPAVSGKKVTAAFDGGRLTSDGGVMLLSLAERRLGFRLGGIHVSIPRLLSARRNSLLSYPLSAIKTFAFGMDRNINRAPT